MRRSSKIMLAICAVLLVFLLGVYLPLYQASKPEMTEQDAQDMLSRLANAFERGSVKDTLSFAAADAKVAGRDLNRIRALLQQAFQYIKQPHVDIKDMDYSRRGDTVHVQCSVAVSDKAAGPDAVLYDQRINFTIQRREIPHFWGLMKTYEWKITNVEAPQVPEELSP